MYKYGIIKKKAAPYGQMCCEENKKSAVNQHRQAYHDGGMYTIL